MFSYIRDVKNFIAKQLWITEEEEDDEDINEILKQMRLEKEADRAKKTYTGVITFINKNRGRIDNEHEFDKEQDSELQVGNKVTYSLAVTDFGRRKAVGVELAPEDGEEDEGWEEYDDAVDDPQSIVCVVAREGRMIRFNNGLEFNVDKIILDCNITPCVGDIFRHIVNEGTKTLTLFPYKIKEFGTIIVENNQRGTIQAKDMRIEYDVSGLGYEPVLGDNVKFLAIRTESGWRAATIDFISPARISDDFEMLDRNSGCLHITGPTDFEQVFLTSMKNLTLQIYNADMSDKHKLTDVRLRNKPQVVPVNLCLPVVIPPGGYATVTFQCQPKFCGFNEERVEFFFNNDANPVVRNFSMMVNAEEVSSFQGLSYKNQKQNANVAHLLRSNRSNRTRPTQQKRVQFKQCQKYKIPEEIFKVFSPDDGLSKTRQEENAALSTARPVLTEPLTPANYAQKFHTLLFTEEMAQRQALARFSKSRVFLRHAGEFLVLDIPGLAEQRPAPVIGDRLVVTQPWKEDYDGTEYEGIIRFVKKDSISVEFHADFHRSYDETICDVKFEMGSSGFSHQHAAVLLANTKLGAKILFPTSLSPKPNSVDLKEEEMVWYNKSLNHGQRLAVVNAIRAECRPLPHIIFGPPGTGKTVTLVETILQTLRLFGNDARIVVAAPSNSAADLLTERIVSGGQIKPGTVLVRLLSYTRMMEGVTEALEPYCMTAYDDDTEMNSCAIGFHRITVGTCASLANLHLRSGLSAGHFTHVFIDEAGYANEPELLIPLTLLYPSSGRAVLAGDPEQLGPVIVSSAAQKFGLGVSFLERVMSRFPYTRDRQGFPVTQGFDPRLITRLTKNYRSVPEILALPNQLFYSSELQATVSGKTGREAEIIEAFHEKVQDFHGKIRDTPITILFHGVRGENFQEHDSPSWLNPQELVETVQYVRMLYGCGVEADELAVIAPYKKQAQKIRQQLDEFNLDLPKIGSVEELQGQERQVVILSCVRSRTTLIEGDARFGLGFIANPKRINVALTRARALLIILGNPHLLSCDAHWRSVITYCLKQGAYVGCNLPDAFVTYGKNNE